MSAYVSVIASPKDADKMAEYSAVAGPLVAQYGGELVCRGPLETLHGETSHKVLVVLKFDTKQAAKDWYNSSEYQAIIPTRNQGMDALFVVAGD
jgi:uncharacterized protein (DUF1330 family)